jgi:putative flippase GtrA
MFSKLNRIFKYYLAGGLNTLFSYCLFAIFLYIGFAYWASVVCCYAIGLFINFKTIKFIAFNDSSRQSLRNFFIIYMGTCLINILSLKGLMTLGVNPYLAAWLVVLPLSLLGYFLNKKFVFIVK